VPGDRGETLEHSWLDILLDTRRPTMRQSAVHTLKLIAAGLCALGLCLVGPATPAPALTVSPTNPTISIGQTQQFTASGNGGGLAATAVSAGGEYTCITLPDGTGQCTGRNQFGQHGNGTINDSTVLDPVSGLTAASHVSAGDEFACALITDGRVKCWGLGESGQRGDRSFSTFGLTPNDVIGLTGATALGTGYGHACALRGDGTMRCWGENREGQLGNGTTATPGTAEPVVVSGVTGAIAIATGAYHTCVLLSGGTVKCWGRNHQGQLGDGTLNSSSTPVQVQTGAGPLTGVTAITAGGAHTCALLADSTVRCWGDNMEGQLGDGTTLGKPTGITVTGLTGAVDISAGWQHSCAVLQDGTARCWGANAFGQLGDGTTTRALTPVQVTGITGATGITAGWWHHSCAVLGDGTAKCWGANEWGQLGNGTTLRSLVPVTVSGTGGGGGGAVTWTSSNPGVATIDASGRATGVGQGVTTITATEGTGDSGSTTLTVAGQRTLSVVRAGSGTGTVTSNPLGIDCGSDCSEPYADDTSVTLTAAAAAGSTLAGWNGCDTTSGTTCTVTMTASRTATVTFDVPTFVLTVNKTGMAAGSGTVTSSPTGINCGADCSEAYASGTVVTLTASSMFFNGWMGCDTVSGTTCTVTMQSARTVRAKFLDMF
jgi:alpha-tubulin suppressor-like RCC1 family protein